MHLSGHDTSVVKDDRDASADAVEFSQLGHRAVVFAEERDDGNSLTGSTDQIMDSVKGGITMATHVIVARDDR